MFVVFIRSASARGFYGEIRKNINFLIEKQWIELWIVFFSNESKQLTFVAQLDARPTDDQEVAG